MKRIRNLNNGATNFLTRIELISKNTTTDYPGKPGNKEQKGAVE